jgi:tRNA-specific 2-thiouridylase
MSVPKTIVVGMSGGVDSSVTALLLKEQGFRVIGVFMKNWDEKFSEDACTSQADFDDVRRVCEKIGIPYYTFNFVKEYWDNVFDKAIQDFRAGYTPNPDVLCNREIKFKVFLEKAMQLGADFLATGHYAQISKNDSGQLLRGLDANKDQSYFLYTLNEKILKKVLFPVGHLPKSEVRKIAKAHGLATAEKKDSTGLCFIGERHFRQFLSQYIQKAQGPIEDLNGKVLGYHEGVAYYTIGQRKGLGIGGAGEPWFVVEKAVDRNALILAQGENHPALFRECLEATELSWVTKQPATPFSCTAKIRYRQSDQACTIEKIEDGRAYVRFSQPQRAVTPRQAIVFYDGPVCLGGGLIA